MMLAPVAACCLAQLPERDVVGPPAPALTSPSLEGIWPTRKMLNGMLRRWAEEVSAQFDMDPAQREQLQVELVDRWSRFLHENRGEIQPVFNEFLEMRMSAEPPEERHVRDWADRTMPVFEKVRDEMNETSAGVRKILKPSQRIEYEAEALKFAAKLALADARLREWKQGRFDPAELWNPPRGTGKAMPSGPVGDRPKADSPRSAEVVEDPIAAELDSWDQYVKEFIERHGLDEGQRTAALSLLEEIKGRAAAHRDRRREEITKLEVRIRTNTGTDQELSEIKKQLDELYGPVDRMFQELRRRLEQLLTATQRERAERESK